MRIRLSQRSQRTQGSQRRLKLFWVPFAFFASLRWKLVSHERPPALVSHEQSLASKPAPRRNALPQAVREHPSRAEQQAGTGDAKAERRDLGR